MFLIVLIGGLLLLLTLGVPIAFGFLLVNFTGAFFIMGGARGLNIAVQQMFSGLTIFALAPIPLFVLLGELMLHSGMATRTFDVLDKWIGRLPGRLSLMVISGGALFSTLSGSTIASTAMLGMITVPIYIPIISALGYDPIWFAILMLLNLEMAMSTPPFGLLLFVMKGVAPPGTTMADIIAGALPFLACDLIVMILLIMFPGIILFLPGLM
jgi:TRAP-type C4-dicarboxylate transport system permease large subunit